MTDTEENTKYTKLGTDPNFSFMNKKMILWKYLPIQIFMHVGSIYALFLIPSASYKTTLYAFLLYYTCNVCILTGAHRLYSHKAFKATWPVRLFLMIFHTIAAQMSTYTWAVDHRVHHKYSDTDADPYNANRGFFFSQFGWTFCRRHRLFRAKLAEVDDSDLLADKIIMFQKKYYLRLYFSLNFIFTFIPVYFWNESWWNSYFISYVLRTIVCLHATGLINSVAHLYGNKPYDKNIKPTEIMLVTWATGGEGWHNYHHTFPWDYKAAELGSNFNISARLIELLARFNLVTDLRTVTPEMVKARTLRTGNGTHKKYVRQNVEKEYNGSVENMVKQDDIYCNGRS